MFHVVPLAVAAFGSVSGLRALWRRRRIATEDIDRYWAAAFPGDRVTARIVGDNGRTALVATDWGVGLLHHGGTEACRIDVASVDQVPTGLRIGFRDGTTAPVTVGMNAVDAAAWAERIEGG